MSIGMFKIALNRSYPGLRLTGTEVPLVRDAIMSRSNRDLEHPPALFFTHSGLQGNDRMMTTLLRIVFSKSTSQQRSLS
jgi:hypothetical protein